MGLLPVTKPKVRHVGLALQRAAHASTLGLLAFLWLGPSAPTTGAR